MEIQSGTLYANKNAREKYLEIGAIDSKFSDKVRGALEVEKSEVL